MFFIDAIWLINDIYTCSPPSIQNKCPLLIFFFLVFFAPNSHFSLEKFFFVGFGAKCRKNCYTLSSAAMKKFRITTSIIDSNFSNVLRS